MKNFLDKIFFRSHNLDYISKDINELTKNTAANKIFDAINLYSSESEIRYVGGCIRKIINKEKVDDIDFATNLEPQQVCEVLKKNNISYFESGIDHGTVTAFEDKFKFEITSLRKDISTDGRHANVEFSKDWKEDASRRDFTINSIYSDKYGNLFDPYNGKKDLEVGKINFIGDTDKRIKEDFLRILRYVRFFLNYSKQSHDPEVIKKLKMNIQGISKLSKERLLDELKKIAKIDTLQKLSKDKISLDIIQLIFPNLKHIKIFSKLNESNQNFLKRNDFIFLISLMIVDETDNVDYFLYKFNISTKNKKRIKNIDNFYKAKISSKTFNESNMNKYFYYYGKEATLDIIYFRLVKLNKVDRSLTELVKYYENKEALVMPVKADFLMKKYEIPQGKIIGEKLKRIEEEWVKNNFKISDQEVDIIVKN